MSGNEYDEQEGFLTRWSRRKAQSLRGEELPEPAEVEEDTVPQTTDEAPVAADDVASVANTETAAEAPDALPELPSLDSLSADSDYSAFMGNGVPAELKQKALRKLFHSAKFNVRDGLDDYDLDFSNPEPLGDIITAEMRYRVKRELERLAGLDEDEQIPEDSPAVATVDAGEHDEADDPPDPEADDERSEPS
jgi:Zn-dependent M28 family amino/carboxypeptidase